MKHKLKISVADESSKDKGRPAVPPRDRGDRFAEAGKMMDF